jgi:hypothetical protein
MTGQVDYHLRAHRHQQQFLTSTSREGRSAEIVDASQQPPSHSIPNLPRKVPIIIMLR